MQAIYNDCVESKLFFRFIGLAVGKVQLVNWNSDLENTEIK